MSLRVRAKIASLTNPALRLVFAVEKNDVRAIERELGNGADPNFLTAEGATMLMAAIASGHREAAKALLEGGADPNRISQFGNTVMDLAADASDADAVVMLLEYGALPSEKPAPATRRKIRCAPSPRRWAISCGRPMPSASSPI